MTLSALVFLSCKEKVVSATTTSGDKPIIDNADKVVTTVNIADYFPGANFMKVIASDNNGLDLTEAQEKTFASWRENNHALVQKKMQQILSLEKEIKTLSQEGADVSEILEKRYETGILRKEIATTKLLCRDLIMETLETGQWDTLVADYEKKFPFVERKKMMNIMQHVNPVPNYMQLINANTSELHLSPEQKARFDTWSVEHHPKMMEMAHQILALEKEIYQTSLQKEPKENIFEKLEDINKLRTKIVETKTSCRDMVAKTLHDDQWKDLVAKTR